MTSARSALPVVFLIASITGSLVASAAAGPWGLAPGQWHSTLEGSAFSSGITFDASGSRVLASRTVEQRALVSTTELGWKRKITLLFALPALSVTRRDASVQGTATGFQDVHVGARFNFANRRTALSIEAGWSAPAGYNRHLDSLGLRLGDGLQELSAGVTAGTSLLGRGFIQASLGYGYRYLGMVKPSQGPLLQVGPIVPGGPHTAQYTWGDRLLASADLGLWLGSSVLVGGRYRGSLDQATGPMLTKSDTHLAGPVMIYRVDDRLDMIAGTWSTISGKSTARFNQAYVGMAFRKTTLNRLQGFLGGKQAP